MRTTDSGGLKSLADFLSALDDSESDRGMFLAGTAEIQDEKGNVLAAIHLNGPDLHTVRIEI